MAISPTYAGYTNTGHDIDVTVVKADGETVNIPNIMEFTSRQETQDITRVRLDNSVLVADLPRLWTGTITFDRHDAGVDGFFAAIDDDWYSGLDYVLGTITIVVATKAAAAKTGSAPVTGEYTTINYHDASVRFEDAGTWKGDDATSCRLTFRAGRRVVVGAGGTVGAAVSSFPNAPATNV